VYLEQTSKTKYLKEKTKRISYKKKDIHKLICDKKN